ncbi:hypothetical protein FKN01_09920 [Streptomyces sp. 130]|uniref:hypothetical protein n=1 Tax=Streptomyces sp. 130 TaxID=2591006 RepID=UPI00117FAAAF|nr:hypothetical protein [Streptomyces sp. 130]TRV79462.1 hypothetical protein FKN01_09920 [Streptomyces sp. 130]
MADTVPDVFSRQHLPVDGDEEEPLRADQPARGDSPGEVLRDSKDTFRIPPVIPTALLGERVQVYDTARRQERRAPAGTLRRRVQGTDMTAAASIAKAGQLVSTEAVPPATGANDLTPQAVLTWGVSGKHWRA